MTLKASHKTDAGIQANDLVAAARIAELTERVEQLEGELRKHAPAIPDAAAAGRKSLSLRSQQQPAKKIGNDRPSAFFSRESLVPEMTTASDTRHVAPSWLPRLPPAAMGRMR
ncbi:TPA: hypothetical protein QDB21_005614 [Burkholderia vietnamiensis]|nr:hypothetical protein [Burkholderia vietnamiensis]